MGAGLELIELREVSRRYGRRYALHGINMRLWAGEVAAILGPNGAGKSTLLQILATLADPSGGAVYYQGWGTHRQVKLVERGSIGWLAPEGLLYNQLTGLENLQFFSELYGLVGASERAKDCFSLVGLEHLAGTNQRVATYSRGMRQRLSLARTLLQRPRLLVLDEPFAGLDSAGRQMVVDVLLGARSEGRLVVLSSHELGLPEVLVDRVFILDSGRLQFAGLCEHPLVGLYERVLGGRAILGGADR